MAVIQNHLVILTVIPIAVQIVLAVIIMATGWFGGRVLLAKILFDLLRTLGMVWLAVCCCAAQDWWTLVPLAGFWLLAVSSCEVTVEGCPVNTVPLTGDWAVTWSWN